MRVVAALLALVVSSAPAFAGGGWSFAVKHDYAGPTCVASTHAGRLTLGFYAEPYGEIYGFVQGVGLPRNALSTWQVNGYEWRQFSGEVDSYNGLHTYAGFLPSFLREVARGSSLDLYLHDRGIAYNAATNNILSVSLRGSSRALSALQKCQAGYLHPVYPDHVQQTPVVYWSK